MTLAEILNPVYDIANSEGRLMTVKSMSHANALAARHARWGHKHGNSGQMLRTGGTSWKSGVTSRSKPYTEVVTGDSEDVLSDDDLRRAQSSVDSLRDANMVSIDVLAGSPQGERHVRLITPDYGAELTVFAGKLFKLAPAEYAGRTPELTVLQDPDETSTSERFIQRELKTGTTLISGTRYFGEFKKSVFTWLNDRAKKTGAGIFLHTGARADYLKTADGKLRRSLMLVAGLSGTGKTSTSCHSFAREHGELSRLIQDDGGTLAYGGNFFGFEPGGYFCKTDGINDGSEAAMYAAAMRPDTVLLNVKVDRDGNPQFHDDYCNNGRMVITRDGIPFSAEEIDFNREEGDHIYVLQLTRGDTMPSIAKLTAEQALAYFALGASQETGAGDPTKKGEFKNVFFYDPFRSGNPAKHLEVARDVFKSLGDDVTYLIANTGEVGPIQGEPVDVRLRHSIAGYQAALRDNIQWQMGAGGLLVPEQIEGVPSQLLHPNQVFGDKGYAQRMGEVHEHNVNVLRELDMPDDVIAALPTPQ